MDHDDERAFFNARRHLSGSSKLGWGSSYSQSYRYGVLTRDLDLRGKTCMLLGCGEGAGVPFLEARGCETIFGFDLLASNIREARKRYGSHRFELVDGTSDAFTRVECVDYVIASGLWNVKGRGDPYEKVEHLLGHASQIRCGLATNFTCNTPDDDEARSFDPLKVLELFVERFRRWKLDHTYFDHDVSIWGFDPILPPQV